MRSPELPAAATLAVISLLIHLPTQIRVRNVATLSLLTYGILAGITCIVNTLVWAGNVRDVAPIWCDISTNISFFIQYAVGSATLSICIQVEQITSFRTAPSPQWPNLRIYLEILAYVVYPIIFIPIRYLLSTNRYMILEDLGCSPAIHPSKFAVSVEFGPQIIVVALIFAFAWKALFNLIRYRYFRTNQVVLPRARFLRLLALCIIVGIWSPTLVPLVFYFTLSLAPLPWTGLSDIHKNFYYIPLLPITTQSLAAHEVQKNFYWAWPASSFLVAAILASGEDFRSDCTHLWAFVLRRRKASSRRITVMISRESHQSTETALSKIPSDVVVSNDDAEKHTLSTDSKSHAFCSKGAHACES